MGCSQNLPRVYSKLAGTLQNHGPAITDNMNCVVTYKVTELTAKKDSETTFFVDMRKKGDGLILLEENMQKLPADLQDKHTYRKPNVAFKMTETTFDAMNKGEIGGFGAWIKG